MSVPTVIPDLGIDGDDAKALLESPSPINPPSDAGRFVYEGRIGDVRLKHEPSLALLLRQVLAIGIHETSGNTNPFFPAPNTFHIRLEGDDVAVWSDENPGNVLSAGRDIDAEYFAREDAKVARAEAAAIANDPNPETVDDNEADEEDTDTDPADNSARAASGTRTGRTSAKAKD